MRLLTILITLIVLLFLLFDFNNRILLAETKNKAQDDFLWVNSNNATPQLTDALKQRLKDSSLKFGLSTPNNTDPKGQGIDTLSMEQQSKQKGQVYKIYIGDWMYTLVAIIFPQNNDDTSAFSLIRGVSVKNKEVKIKKVQASSYFEGYRISIQETKTMTFSNDEQSRHVILTMYQPKLSEDD